MAYEVKYDPIKNQWYVQQRIEGDGVLQETGSEFVGYYPSKSRAIDMAQGYAGHQEDVVIYGLEGGSHVEKRRVHGRNTRTR